MESVQQEPISCDMLYTFKLDKLVLLVWDALLRASSAITVIFFIISSATVCCCPDAVGDLMGHIGNGLYLRDNLSERAVGRFTISAVSSAIDHVFQHDFNAMLCTFCKAAICCWISTVASDVRFARLRTSSATTAKPRPCSPALALSMAAFKASKLVCSATCEIVSIMLLILLLSAAKCSITVRVSWICCWHSANFSHYAIHDLVAMFGRTLGNIGSPGSTDGILRHRLHAWNHLRHRTGGQFRLMLLL